jgi:hypothetical protein
MDSGMISKIEKARLYAQEPQRVTFEAFIAIFQGDNQPHQVSLDEHGLTCDCRAFRQDHPCSHVMATERMIGHMLKRPLVQGESYPNDVEKARLYSHEPYRLKFKSFEVRFEGDHNDHRVSYDHGQWNSPDEFFQSHGASAHSIALERILKHML